MVDFNAHPKIGKFSHKTNRQLRNHIPESHFLFSPRLLFLFFQLPKIPPKQKIMLQRLHIFAEPGRALLQVAKCAFCTRAAASESVISKLAAQGP
jgi:hypothetical protein